METLTSVLGQTSPAFAVKGSQVKVLSEPSEFYQELCQRAERSRQRIAIAALYLGTGDMAKSLVDCVRRSLKSTGGHTRTIFLLDYCRGNRLDVKGQTSCSILAPLISEFSDSCQVSLYHTPDLYGLKKRLLGPKFNETVGLQHLKLYVFDNSVILSGANLSTDYFTNRQDRYVIVEDCEPFASFCESLVRKISEFSLELETDGSFRLPQDHPAFQGGDYQKFVTAVKASLTTWLLENTKYIKNHHQEDSDTWIFPSIQMGPFNVRHDSDFTERFLRAGGEEQGARFNFATGYFNLTRNYQNIILNESKGTNFSSPKL